MGVFSVVLVGVECGVSSLFRVVMKDVFVGVIVRINVLKVVKFVMGCKWMNIVWFVREDFNGSCV